MKSIAILITVHNRKVKTLFCLDSLFKIDISNYKIDVFVTDDGCTDGTQEAIMSSYPQVNLVLGDGSLFWNRGMYRAWEVASRKKDYDYYLWLNDDTILFKDAIKIVLEGSDNLDDRAIICGATCSNATNEVTYSGWLKSSKEPLKPNGLLQMCEIVNGNFLLVPKIIFQKIGNLDWKFRHAIGDFDYGLRAQKAGFKCFVAPEFIGTCEVNPSLPKWCIKSTPLMQRFRLLYSPLGYAEPIPFFIYEKRHFGIITAIKHFITINLRALCPQLWE